MKRRDLLKGATGLAALLAAGRAPGVRASAGARLRILFTNDIHGHLRPVYHREPHGAEFLKANGIAPGSELAYLASAVDFPSQAKRYGRVGGMAQLATLIRREREGMPDRTLLLDGGDAWYGSGIALLTQGRALVEVMNAIGYEAGTLHWELNLGRAVLEQRIKESRFPILAQNLVDKEFEDPVLKPYLVKELGGIRVGILGQAYQFSVLTTEDPRLTEGWQMGYRIESLRAHLKTLREKEKVDLLVLLSHMGYAQDVAVLRQIEGVDVVVGAHTHDILLQPARVGKTLVTQAGSHGKFLGVLDLEVRDRRIESFHHRLIPVLAERIEPDREISRLIETAYQPHQARLERVVGMTETLLYRRDPVHSPSDQLIARAYRDIGNADIGHAPGWRFGTTILPGEIRMEDVYDAFKPTPAHLFVPRLTGDQVRAFFEDALDNVYNPDPLLRLGGDMFRFSGLEVKIRLGNARGRRVVELLHQGKAVEGKAVYRLATSGGRVQRLAGNPGDQGKPAVDSLLRYVGDHSPIRFQVAENLIQV
jgi:sulfur-oxidizing protein SoxB